MPDLQTQIRSILDEAVGKLAAVFQQAAVAGVTAGIGGTASEVGTKGRSAARSVASRQRAKGTKRAPAEIEALQRRLADFIGENPGLRVEQINAQLGTSTQDLSLPLRKLVAAKKIKTKGEKRATSYFPAQAERTAKKAPRK